MQIKKFEAPTIQEALDTIKKELGPEAIILQTKTNRKGFGLLSGGSVEVTAAVSDRSIQKKKVFESKIEPSQRDQMRKMPAEKQASMYNVYAERHLEVVAKKTTDSVQFGKKLPATRYVDIADIADTRDDRKNPLKAPQPSKAANRPAPSVQVNQGVQVQVQSSMSGRQDIEKEMLRLKKVLSELKTAQEEIEKNQKESLAAGSGPSSILDKPLLREAFETLTLGGLEKRYAIELARAVAFELSDKDLSSHDRVMDQLAHEVVSQIQVTSLLGGLGDTKPIVMAMVGPTGVGKTTTVAKIASDAILNHKLKVALINFDTYKVAASEQLATYAKILNIPFRNVENEAGLKAAIQDFADYNLVLIDTTGRSQRDGESLKEAEVILHTIPAIRTHLVLSATTRDMELYDIGTRFAVFRPETIVVSKLDEALTFGCVYNVQHKLQLPLSYFTTGQRVPEDLEAATAERLAALIMGL